MKGNAMFQLEINGNKNVRFFSSCTEGGVKRITVPGQFSKKVTATLSQTTSQAWWFMPVIPPIWEAKTGESQDKANPG
jgi:hypothetical protein